MIFYPILAYLIGSLLFSVIICRLAQLKDPRTYGSKNPGATNTFRQSKSTGLLVFALDFTKGLIIAWLALKAMNQGYSTTASLTLVCGLLGHMFSIFFGLGGKGVATALGFLITLNPTIGLFAVTQWAILCKSLRNVGIASTITTGISTLILAISGHHLWLAMFFNSTIILARHKNNINQWLYPTTDN